MRSENAAGDSPLGPMELRKLVPFEPYAASYSLGWVGLEAVRYHNAPGSEIDVPPLTHHAVVLITRPPERFELRFAGVKRHAPPPTGSFEFVPAGLPALWGWRGYNDSLHVYLEPALLTRVAAEVFGLDPARMAVPPLDGLELPHLRIAMEAVDAELAARGPGGRLAAESLANVLAVHLIRHILAPAPPVRGLDGVMPQSRLRAVVDYIEEHLGAAPTL